MSEEKSIPFLRALFFIVDTPLYKKASAIISKQDIHFYFQSHCEGTASSEVLDWLGLGRTEKVLGICVAQKDIIYETQRVLTRELQLIVPGNGITFTTTLSHFSKVVLQTLVPDEADQERIRGNMGQEVDRYKENAEFSLIMAIINQGFTEELMKEARSAGARGGTSIHSRGVGLEEALRNYGITVQQEKEIVLILTKEEDSLAIMRQISKTCGFNSAARGIIFALPVNSVTGIEIPELEKHV